MVTTYSAKGLKRAIDLTNLVQHIQHLHSRLKVYASISDTDPVLEQRRASWWDVLTPLINIRLYHHTGDVSFARGKLFAYINKYKRLIVVVLLRVTI
jgi:hypothetical protein